MNNLPEKKNKRNLLGLPDRDTDGNTVYDQLYLVPSGKKHESGWMMVAIIGIQKVGEEYFGEIAAWPDDINWNFEKCGGRGVRTDCLYPSGILHFWGREVKFVVGYAYSSTDITVVHV